MKSKNKEEVKKNEYIKFVELIAASVIISSSLTFFITYVMLTGQIPLILVVVVVILLLVSLYLYLDAEFFRK